MTDERERAQFFLEAGWGWWMERDACFHLGSDPANPYPRLDPIPKEEKAAAVPPRVEVEPALRRLFSFFMPQKPLGN